LIIIALELGRIFEFGCKGSHLFSMGNKK